MERERLEVLQEYPAVPVHYRLREARRPGGVEYPERVVERDLLELDGPRAAAARGRPSRSASGHRPSGLADHDRPLDARDRAPDVVDHVGL